MAKTKKKRLIISHIHVWDRKNKGDVGIVIAVQELLKKKFSNCRILDFPVETLKEYKRKDIDKINSSDLVVIGGGGIFYHWFMPYSIKVIDAIKVPIVIFGTGYIREVGARKLAKNEVDSIIYLNNKASLVGVRDFYTKNFLVKNGIKASEIDLIGDPAILLSEVKSNIKLKGKLKIGLNLNYSGWLGFGKWEKQILKAYKEVAEYFQIKGADIYYLMHHPGEKNIYPKLRIKDLKIINIDPREQKYIYGKLDLVIGMMLHSCVMAFGAGTPEINVAYDIRNKNFAKFIGCPELFVNLEDLERGVLLEKAKMVISKEKKYREKFDKKIIQINKKHDKFLDKINQLIQGEYEK